MELQTIREKIYEIRGQRVMLDFDLAALYQVETRALKQAVRRNIERFEGEDFMFELTPDEYNSLIDILRSQNVISNITSDRGGTRYMPFAFTEQGVAMLSSVLRSRTAIEINRGVMRAFVRVRDYLASQHHLSAELAELRSRLALVERDTRDNLAAMNDLSEDLRRDIDTIYEAIGALSVKLPQARSAHRPIGFKRDAEADS